MARGVWVSCLAALLADAVAPPAAADGIPIAVTEIRGRIGVDKVLVRVVEEYIVNQVAAQSRFTVFGRDDFRRLLAPDQQQQLQGCEADACLVEIGGAMGVELVMAGSIDKVGASLLITLKIIDVKRGKVLAREAERLRGASEDAALEAIDKLLRRLFRWLSTQGRDLPKLAVTEIRTRRGVDSVLSRVVEDYLAGEIAKTGLYKVINRDDIRRMVAAEQQRKLDDCDEALCWYDIGGALGAKKLLAGSIDRVGSHLLVTLKLLDVKRASVSRREAQKIKGLDEEAALDAVARLYRRLFQPELAALSASREDDTARARYRRDRGDDGDGEWVAAEDADEPVDEHLKQEVRNLDNAPELVPVAPVGDPPASRPGADAALLDELNAEAEAGVEAMPAVDVGKEGGSAGAAVEPGSAGAEAGGEAAPGSGRFWTWIAATVGVASLGGGTGLEIVAARDGSELDDLLAKNRRGEPVSYSQIRDLQDSEKQKGTAGHILLAMGGALAVTAVVLFFVEASGDADEVLEDSTVSLVPLLGRRLGGVGLSGRF